MASDAYIKALSKIMTDKHPPPMTTRTRAEIEADIVAISAELRGPLDNVSRLGLVEARTVLRKQLEGFSSDSG